MRTMKPMKPIKKTDPSHYFWLLIFGLLMTTCQYLSYGAAKNIAARVAEIIG